MGKINRFSNRIAHHEPIWFQSGAAMIDSSDLMQNYFVIQNLFIWMNINGQHLLFGLDHIQNLVNKLNTI